MIYQASDLKTELESRGYEVNYYQEEDEFRCLDAEVHLGGNVVIQIDLSGTAPEFGATIEAFKKKRKNSGFRHLGYFTNTKTLINAIKDLIPTAGATSAG